MAKRPFGENKNTTPKKPTHGDYVLINNQWVPEATARKFVAAQNLKVVNANEVTA
jgi:hypothetical protein